MTSDVVKRELRRRGNVDDKRKMANAEAEKAAHSDAVANAPSNEERDKLIREQAAAERKANEAIVKQFRAGGKSGTTAAELAEAKKASAKATAELQADADTAKRPDLTEVKLSKGKVLTLHEHNMLARERDASMRDENRDAAKAAGKAVLTVLDGSGRGVRGRHSKLARAASAQRDLAAAGAVAGSAE